MIYIYIYILDPHEAPYGACKSYKAEFEEVCVFVFCIVSKQTRITRDRCYESVGLLKQTNANHDGHLTVPVSRTKLSLKTCSTPKDR